MTISKAEQKRRKDAKSALSSNVGRILLDFQNKYLQSYADWNEKKIQRRLDLIKDFRKEDFIGINIHDNVQVRNLLGYAPNRYNADQTFDKYDAERVERIASTIAKRLDRSAINRREWFNEAFDSYQVKFDTMIDKLVDAGFTSRDLRVELVASSASQLEFLISNQTTECHARAIWVEGDIKAPHYRFITTTRQKK